MPQKIKRSNLGETIIILVLLFFILNLIVETVLLIVFFVTMVRMDLYHELLQMLPRHVRHRIMQVLCWFVPYWIVEAVELY